MNSVTVQFAPGRYRLTNGLPAKVSKVKQVMSSLGGWMLVGFVNLRDNVWVMSAWTLSGRSTYQPDYDLAEKEEDHVP
jgi:hypothetical protein